MEKSNEINKLGDNKFHRVLLRGANNSLRLVAAERMDEELFEITERLEEYFEKSNSSNKEGDKE